MRTIPSLVNFLNTYKPATAEERRKHESDTLPQLFSSASSSTKQARFARAKASIKLFCIIIALTAVAVAGLSTVFASPASSQNTNLARPATYKCWSDYVGNADLPSPRPVGYGNDLRDDCVILINQYFGTWSGTQSHLPADHPLRQWGTPSYTHISDWPGVTVETVNGAKRVTGLDLSNSSSTNRGIDSTGFQTNFQSLTALKTLDISGNNFSGGLPLLLTGLNELTTLDLSGNGFAGSVHLNFTNMTSLTELHLQNNNLSGSIPSEISNLLPSPRGSGSLTKLGICGNGFSGTLPRDFYQGASGAPELVDYPHSEGYNPLACQPDRTGTAGTAIVPINSAHCNNGTFVDAPAVPGNLNNDLREDCEHLVALQHDLAGHSSNEGLPSSHLLNSWGVGDSQKITTWPGVTVSTVSGVQRVTGLDLSNQNLYGGIGPPITRLLALEDLNLSNNNFSGTPSDCLGRLRLKKLNLSNNNLRDTGSTIEYIWLARDSSCDLLSGNALVTTFTEIDLSGNNFTGLPNNFVGLTSLTKFDVSDNQMIGVIPGDISRLTSLVHFDISDNQLSGYITGNLDRLTALEHFDVSNNRLTGTIPGNTGNLKNVATFNVSNNLLSGSTDPLRGLAKSAASPGSLDTLGICGNSFEGALPSELRDDATDAPDLLDYPVSEGYDPVACQDDGDWFVRHIKQSSAQVTETSSQFAARIGMRPGQVFYQWNAPNQIWQQIPRTSTFGSIAPGTALAFRLPSDVDFLPSEARDSLNVADENLTFRLFNGWNVLAMGGTVNRDTQQAGLSFFDDSLTDCATLNGVIAVVRLSSQGEASVELPCHPSSQRNFAPISRITEGDAVFVYFRSTLPVYVTWDSNNDKYTTP